MEGNIMERVKKHPIITTIIVITIVLVLPLCINVITKVKIDCNILQEPSEWTKFCGEYLGTIISAVVAFIILYVQRNDNKEQNSKNRIENEALNEKNRSENKKQNQANRQLQLSILKYQQEMQWLKELKIKCIEYINGFDKNGVVNITSLMLNDDYRYNKNNIEKLLEQLCAKKNNSEFSFRLMFDMFDEQEQHIIKDLDYYSNLYKVILYDLSWLYNNIYEGIEIGTEDKYKMHNETCLKQYKQNSVAVYFLETTNYSTFDYANSRSLYNKAIKVCLNKVFELNNIKNRLLELVNYEHNKINRIITI